MKPIPTLWAGLLIQFINETMNKVILIGNVGKEPETRVAGESKVAQFSLATTERGFTTQSGKKIEDRTEWHNIIAWGGLASLSAYIHKGTTVSVEGKLTYRSYEKDGTTRYITEIIAEKLEIIKDGKTEAGRKNDDPF